MIREISYVFVFQLINPLVIQRLHGNEPPDSIKRWEVLGWLHNWQHLKMGSAPWVSESVSE
jgi:hypothetical protein